MVVTVNSSAARRSPTVSVGVAVLDEEEAEEEDCISACRCFLLIFFNGLLLATDAFEVLLIPLLDSAAIVILGDDFRVALSCCTACKLSWEGFNTRKPVKTRECAKENPWVDKRVKIETTQSDIHASNDVRKGGSSIISPYVK